MKVSHKARLPRNGILLPDDLPLFRWALYRPASPQLSRASQRIAKRFGLSPHLARACAELAGLPSERNEHA
jgi:hypothetical protein